VVVGPCQFGMNTRALPPPATSPMTARVVLAGQVPESGPPAQPHSTRHRRAPSQRTAAGSRAVPSSRADFGAVMDLSGQLSDAASISSPRSAAWS